MKRLFRNRTKIIVCLVLLAFLIFCIGPIFFLPDLRGGLSTKAGNVYKVYREIKRVAPELIIPAPPSENSSQIVRYHGNVKHSDKLHIREDRERLKNKINSGVLEKPVIGHSPSADVAAQSNKEIDEEKLNNVEINADKQILPPQIIKSSKKPGGNPVIQGGEDADPKIRKKREKVVEMTMHGWSNYKLYAWGKNELRPKSKRGHTAGIFGQDMGATIVDAMDTLYIMGLMEEFNAGKAWIAENLNFDRVTSEMSVFETNIRFIGGLLTLFSFTGDPLFRDKAYHIAKKLLPAFSTKTGIPHGLINIATGYSKNYAWASGGSSILSEFGTLHLEFVYLSHITGDPVFKEKVLKIRDFVRKLERPADLYPNYLNPKTGNWGQRHTSVGALGDSFYEYLIKAYIQSGYKDKIAREMYQTAIRDIDNKLIMKSKSGLTYLAEYKFDRLEHKMDHLACFAAGMFSLGAHVIQDELSKKYHNIGAEIAHTCHESYNGTPTGLGPESFRFTDTLEAKALKSNEKYYILRPEVIEGWFYLWRLTHDQKYRVWAWEALLAIDKFCRLENGFSGISNVYSELGVKHDDVQQSFLFAETFKYLYLIFSDDSLISLDEWVFNTEGHPLPIYGNNDFYRPANGIPPIWESNEVD